MTIPMNPSFGRRLGARHFATLAAVTAVGMTIAFGHGSGDLLGGRTASAPARPAPSASARAADPARQLRAETDDQFDGSRGRRI